MSKKTKIKKSVKKPKIPPSKAIPEGDAISGIIVIAALLAMALVGYYTLKGPSFSEGDCFIDRSYQPVIVRNVFKYSEQIQFMTARVEEVGDWSEYRGWFLAGNYDSRIKTFEFVEDNYTKIKCNSLLKVD